MEQGRERGVRLLSLDGGGIRGVSELLIIDRMMKRIKQEQRLAEVPKPCEYFDMIGGTGTGGLIALLLGRLRMSTEDAIKCYADFSQRIFSAKQIGRDGKFSANKLRDAIRGVVGRETGNADELMRDSRPNTCKVFVVAKLASSLDANRPILFRTYEHSSNVECQIWEAARATTATPTFFEPCYDLLRRRSA